MNSFAVLAIALLASAQGPGGLPKIPVVIESGELDPCGNGVVVGLDPRADGFLAVRSGPSAKYQEVDRLYNGEQAYMCDFKGDWVGVVYSRDRASDCNVMTPWVRTLPYTGPCKSGWVHKRWIELWAG